MLTESLTVQLGRRLTSPYLTESTWEHLPLPEPCKHSCHTYGSKQPASQEPCEEREAARSNATHRTQRLLIHLGIQNAAATQVGWFYSITFTHV